MSYSVRLRQGTNTLLTFGTHCPIVEPTYEYDYDDGQPRLLTQIFRTFVIEGVLYGKVEVDVETAYATLMTAIESPGVGTQPDSVQLLRGGFVVQEISTGAGYDSFEIQSFRSPRSDLQWRGELRFTLKITGTLKFGDPVVKLTIQDTYSYDEAGLLTHTRQGELVTRADTSAKKQCETFDGVKIALPSASFGYVTNGAGGVDIHVLDKADTHARFTCTIRQTGKPLPKSVGPSFSVTQKETLVDGEIVTTTTATARGTGALAAVKSVAPAGSVAQSTDHDDFQLTASAVYVQRRPADGNVVITRHTFESSGGGRPIKFTPRTGGRKPAKHVGAFLPVEVRESLRVELTGLPELSAFTFPGPIEDGETFSRDESGNAVSEPSRISIGTTPAGDRWAVDVRRLYRGTSLHELHAAIAASFSAPPSTIALEDETQQVEGL